MTTTMPFEILNTNVSIEKVDAVNGVLKYPIAETFKSPQGEGQFTGTYFAFIRFAGCTVGKPYTAAERIAIGAKVYQEKCTAAIGNESFACDTNYKMAAKMSVSELVDFVGDTEHVCLTGGEPLMHDLEPLVTQFLRRGKMIHIETSGTKRFDNLLSAAVPYGVWKIWVAISPKAGYIPDLLNAADEIKVLYGDRFTEEEFIQKFGHILHKVWIQPINDENTLNMANVKKCIALQAKYPAIRISVQTHKILGVR
jgi:organic radical activating enzyme